MWALVVVVLIECGTALALAWMRSNALTGNGGQRPLLDW